MTQKEIVLERSGPQGRDRQQTAYAIPWEAGLNVLGALLHIYETVDPSLAFRHSCRFKHCGLCAVTVNGKARLACLTLVPESGPVVVGPLRKFPVLRDLVVDRRAVVQWHRDLRLFLPRPAGDGLPAAIHEPRERRVLSNCVECLCCLADDPLYEHETSKAGPYHFVKLAQFHFDPRDGIDRAAQARQLGVARYREQTRFNCPVGIPIWSYAIKPFL